MNSKYMDYNQSDNNPLIGTIILIIGILLKEVGTLRADFIYEWIYRIAGLTAIVLTIIVHLRTLNKKQKAKK